MDLRERVMEILDGRIAMGAGAAKKTKRKPKKKPALRRVPEMYAEKPQELPTALARLEDPRYFLHHYPTEADIQDVAKGVRDRQKAPQGGMCDCPTCGGAGAVLAPMQSSKSYGGGFIKDRRERDYYDQLRDIEHDNPDQGLYTEALERADLNYLAKKHDFYFKDYEGGVTIGGKCPKGCKCTNCKSAPKKKSKKPKKESEWIRYVKEFAKMNKMTYGEAMKKAGPSYHKQA